jgi:D-glutamate N-acetyltransferase
VVLIPFSAPHLFVLCHQAGSTEIEGFPGHPLPSLSELVELHERLSLPARPARVACIALNTRQLSEEEARAAIAAAEAETGLPADDPVRFGAGKLLDSLLRPR